MIHLSQAAAQEVKRLKLQQKRLNSLFRIGVQPSGCAGMSYTMTFDETVQSHDQVYNCDGIQIVVDPQSLSYIEGLTLDYSEDLMGGGFRFHNPQAVQSCGCGNSFSVD